jgi:hypothetical protein
MKPTDAEVWRKLSELEFIFDKPVTLEQGERYKCEWAEREMKNLFAEWRATNPNTEVPDENSKGIELFIDYRYLDPIRLLGPASIDMSP